ncbi:uncharacterized protein [Lolium perenne]|jgi:hypothetical protein|uniref:uncharacterized protein n=1 Tax=Lolium perenne TaxID=4522 RepID=UPI0021EA8F4F|nr:uncharacterized protein LOC127338633 [Lolium perenne]
MANHAAAALLIASLLVAVTLADARITLQVQGGNMMEGNAVRTFVKSVPALTCNKVLGFQEGDTCFDIAQGSGLTQDQFLSFNPNINCAKVFIGQWVCLDASSA